MWKGYIPNASTYVTEIRVNSALQDHTAEGSPSAELVDSVQENEINTNFRSQSSQTCRIFTRMPPALWSWFGFLSFCESIQHLLGRFWRQVLLHMCESKKKMSLPDTGCNMTWGAYVEVIVDDEHGSVAARPLALHLDDRKFPVFRCLTGFDTAQVLAYGV